MQENLYCHLMLLRTCPRVSFRRTLCICNQLAVYVVKRICTIFHDILLLLLISGYEDLTRRLVTALQDSISADINGASENEV